MKKTVLSLFTFFALLLSVQAQNSITLNIHHKLADVDFAFEEGAKNNINHDFNVTRLQYYMSGFSLVHDGGTETAIANDFHMLVNASQATEIDLGEHEVTNLEAIRFHIGVHPEVNHEDPASYPNGHPLAPVFPSMHWGWAAGYRFVAIEGMGSDSYNQLYQLHGLGDDNYFMTEIPLELTAENGEIIIDLDGDYTRILEDITVNAGIISHGEFGDAKKALQNFRDFVFSPTGQTVSSAIDFSEVTSFSVYPNPTYGMANIAVSATMDLTYSVSITDILGRQVQYFDEVKSNSPFVVEVAQPGLYVVNLMKEGQTVVTQKLMVK